jgi:flagellar basal body-associated protein FliL
MKWFRNNGLSIVFFVLFLIALCGQALTGLKEHNKEMQEDGGKQVSLSEYFSTGHFLQSTFENWESEFLQMALYVVLTIFLFQKGSSESKDPDGDEPVDKEPNRKKKDAPYPVHKGGLLLTLYKNSLTIVLFLLFAASFVLHFYGSMKDYNEAQNLKGEAVETAAQYLSNSRFWFESFQNWQSEFLSVFAIVILSIFLRQKGSPQSKPVDAPNSETGE